MATKSDLPPLADYLAPVIAASKTRGGSIEVMKFATSAAITFALVTLATNPANALRAEVQNWSHWLTHHIPAFQTYCLNEVFRREGLDTELMRTFGINSEDPQVLALRRYCESRKPIANMWPALALKLGRDRHHGNHHLRRHKHRSPRALPTLAWMAAAYGLLDSANSASHFLQLLSND